jgi:3,4-dihydroxy-2-butanone 4-phosphate synthase
MKGFTSIDDAIQAIRAGEMIIVVDDENRENEGDLLMAADKVSPAHVNFMITHARGSFVYRWKKTGYPPGDSSDDQ